MKNKKLLYILITLLVLGGVFALGAHTYIPALTPWLATRGH
jgi:hypothetical protein